MEKLDGVRAEGRVALPKPLGMGPPKLVGYEFPKAEIDEAVEKNRLVTLFIAFNDECNLACPFCFSRTGKRSQMVLAKEGVQEELLSLPELKGMVKQAKGLGAKSVCIYGEGEPLLDKGKVFALIDEINQQGMVPVIFTNGTMVDEETAKRLFDAGVSVIGKLYSLKPLTNEELTGNKNLYDYVDFCGEIVPAYIKRLMDAGFAGTNRLALHTAVNSANKDEILDMWKWERRLQLLPFMDFLYEPHPLDLSVEERKALRRKVWELDNFELSVEYEWMEESPRLGHRMCDKGGDIFVGNTGRARVCADTYVHVGSIREKTLAELMEEKKAKNEELKRCRVCGMRCECFRHNLKERDESGGGRNGNS